MPLVGPRPVLHGHEEFFPSYYKILSLFQTRATTDTDRASDTVTLDELKAHIERCKVNHEDPETARIIVITTYSTTLRRLVKCSKPVKMTAQELQSQVNFEDLGETDNDNDDDSDELKKDKVAYHIPREILLKDAAAINKVVKALDYNAWLGISATPATSNARDYLGYAEVIWDGNFPFSYNSLTEETIATDRLRGRSSLDQEPPASAKTTLASERYEQGLQAGIPMFMFDPRLLSRFALESKLGLEYSQNAIRPIIKAIVIRSTMFTEVLLPDGEKTSISKDMPDMVVTTVELSSRSGDNRANVMSFIEKA
ncbi:Uncharacterized protein TCAP_04968 [Tolypocladium capitatum]|uniref:Uncharacterized protein n=1 Tax=Tolypocladium capitatum TaxID=45235 RepID=A0A2K3QC34_9HYPO|nr:Uncharacterized protein TCAP_04968 [Tolypocladium capitatum]